MHVLAFNPLSADGYLSSLGAFGVFLVLFAETGLLIGFFLPGDSLLFTAGLLCTTTSSSGVHLNLAAVLPAAAAGALLGAQTGYWIGKRGGRPLLARSGNRHLQRGVVRAEQILTRYGQGKAIVLSRFIPVVRTVVNPLAGILEVPARTFLVYQAAGGLVWSIGVTLAGYALGSSIPNIDNYLLPIIALIVVLSLIPLALELLRSRRADRADQADRAEGADAANATEHRANHGNETHHTEGHSNENHGSESHRNANHVDWETPGRRDMRESREMRQTQPSREHS